MCVASGCPVAAQSTSCDPNLKQEAQPQGYRQRGDRCEGYFIQPVAGGRLDIQSFAEARRIEVAGKSELTLGWPSFGSEAVQVRAYSLSPKEYYRMDTVRPSGQTSYTWPVGIPASRNLAIGLVSWTKALLGASRETVYLPVSLTGASSGAYTITLVPSVTAEQVYVTIAAINSDGSRGRVLRNRESLNLGYYPAFRSIPVSLPPLPAGLYRADFAAAWENGSSATAGMFFYSAGFGKPAVP
ncbi:MAG: hypothetical protein ABL961_14395 [Vicinamibacterales bacterium]